MKEQYPALTCALTVQTVHSSGTFSTCPNGDRQGTQYILSNVRGEGVKPVMRFIPQKHSLVFIKCFFLALRENKEKSKYSK